MNYFILGVTMDKKMSKAYERKLEQYKKLAKKADAQLRQIERVSNPNRKITEKTSERMKTEIIRHRHLKDYAYKTAQNDIQKLYGGGNRFDRVAYTTVNGKKEYIPIEDLNKRINAIENFLSKPSAYLRATNNHSSYSDALNRSAAALSDKLSKELGVTIKLSPEEIKEFMDIAEQQGLLNDAGKYQAYEAVATYQDNARVREAIKQAKERTKNYKDANAKATVIRKELKKAGLGKAESATIASMAASGVDFEAFSTIV